MPGILLEGYEVCRIYGKEIRVIGKNREPLASESRL
jgi:hypothetical protein